MTENGEGQAKQHSLVNLELDASTLGTRRAHILV